MSRLSLFLSPGGRVATAAAALAFLALGFGLRPERPTAPRSEEAAAPLLQEVVQQREARSFFRALQDVAAAAVRHSVYVSVVETVPEAWSDWDRADNVGPTDRYGVLVGAGEVLAYGGALPSDAQLRVRFSDGRTQAGQITTRFPSYGLVLIEVEGSSDLPVPARQTPTVRSGDAVVATAPHPDGQVVAPLFVSRVARGVTVTTTPLDAFRGMPVFSADQALLGIIGDVDGEPRVIRIDAVMAADSADVRPGRRLGVSLGRAAVAVGDSANTVAVTGVAPDGPAFEAGIRAGDLLTAIDGERIDDLQQAVLRLTAEPPAPLRLQVRRGRRLLTVTIPAGDEVAR